MNAIRSAATRPRPLLASLTGVALMMQVWASGAGDNAQATGDSVMNTRATVQQYFDALDRKDGWEQSFAEDVAFTSFTSPVKQVSGRAAYLTATQRFYGSIRSAKLRELLIDGDRACALTRYELQPPNGAAAFISDVAEIFTVRDGKIQALAIYFDSAPFPK